MKILRVRNQLLYSAERIKNLAEILKTKDNIGCIPEWLNHEAEKMINLANSLEETNKQDYSRRDEFIRGMPGHPDNDMGM